MSFNALDLAFIGLDVKDIILPKSLRFLIPYFNTYTERIFLNYYYCFGDSISFVDYTGIVLDDKTLIKLKDRYDVLISTRKKAIKKFNIKRVYQIDTNNYRLRSGLI